MIRRFVLLPHHASIKVQHLIPHPHWRSTDRPHSVPGIECAISRPPQTRMAESKGIRHKNYHLHPQDDFLGQARSTVFVSDPVMGFRFNTTHMSRMNSHVPTFIPEPRIRAAQVQSPRFRNEVPLRDDDDIYNERSLRQVKSMISTPTTLLEKATEPRFLSGFSTNAHGIMSENVQQRYLFSKTPNYGPLSISTPTSYHPPPSNTRQVSDVNLFDHEESHDYNHRFKPFGRRLSDAREPMPKLGQGDARIGEGILFGARKIDSNRSPQPLTFPTRSPPKTHNQQGTTAFGSNPGDILQRAPPPPTNRASPERLMRKAASAQQSRSSNGNNYQYSIATGDEGQLRTNSFNSWSEEVYSNTMREYKKSGSHQFDATAPVFQPAVLSTARVRPAKWNIQCRWTFSHVNDCRYGSTCNWGHEGDEYFDEPGVKHSFANLGGQASDEAGQVTKQGGSGGPVHFKALFESGSKQQSDGGSQNYGDSLPDFSWVGGATNVDSWIGNQGKGGAVYGKIQTVSKTSGGPLGEGEDYKDATSLGEQPKKEELLGMQVVGDIKDDKLHHVSRTQGFQKMRPEIEKITERIERGLSISFVDAEKLNTGSEDALGNIGGEE